MLRHLKVDWKTVAMGEKSSVAAARTKARKRAYHQAHKQEANLRRRAWTKANPEKARSMWLKKRYGITLEHYNTKLIAQGGICYVCKGSGPLCVDHDHSTGLVRGLLCDACNKALGLLEENRQSIQNLLTYLDTWRPPCVS